MSLPLTPAQSRRRVARLTVLSLLIMVCRLSGADPGEPDDLKQQADRWIELEKRIADERNDWRSEKEILAASIEVLKKEQEVLKGKEAANALAAELFRNRLDQTHGEFAEHESAQRALAARARALETRVRLLLPRLPEPLKDRLAPQLQKLEASASGEPITVAERTQLLISVLASIDAFNNTLTLTHHLRPGSGSEMVDVKVLYWGLAMAYAVDASGGRAWLVAPGAGGWDWQEQPAYVAQIKALIDIYEKKKSPVLLELPAPREGGAR